MTATDQPPWDDLTIPPHARKRGITLNLYDQLSAYVPQRPGAYLRISSDRFGLEAGVERQHDDAEDTRNRLGWAPFAKTYRENDTSAFKKRKVIRPDGTIDWVVMRPKFRQLLVDLSTGVIDGVIFYDLDRLVRQPRDLEDLIDIVEYVQHPVIGATGGRMNLINDSDRHMARMMCVMALKSSEDTARRVARMHLAAAQQGKIQGRIAYGWVRSGPHKGRHLPDEAAVVRGPSPAAYMRTPRSPFRRRGPPGPTRPNGPPSAVKGPQRPAGPGRAGRSPAGSGSRRRRTGSPRRARRPGRGRAGAT